MHRLTVFFHHIVSDINDIVYGTDAACCQSPLHPFGTFSNLYILYHSCAVPGAEVGCLHFNLYHIIYIFTVSGFFYNRRYKGLVKSCSHFPCDSQYGIAVHTVGCDLVLKYGIVQAKSLYGVITGLKIRIVKNVYTVLRCLRIKIPV